MTEDIELEERVNLLNARFHIRQLQASADGEEVIEEVAERYATSDVTPSSTVEGVLAECIREYAGGQQPALLADRHHIPYNVLANAIDEVAERASGVAQN